MFPGGNDTHRYAATSKDPTADLVVDVDDGELRLRLPVESKIEIAREYLPARAVVQLDDMAFIMCPDLHALDSRPTVSPSGKRDPYRTTPSSVVGFGWHPTLL